MNIRRILKGDGSANAFASLVAILVGLLFGFIILLISNPSQALRGLAVIASGGFSGGMKGVGQVFYYASPLIMTGLSVGFAFKTGLFNIGATGQLTVGSFVAVYVGANWTFLPGSILWVVALLAAMVAGSLWGAIPGFFKAKLNVNEVIACIMCNYISLYGVNYLIKNSNIFDPRFNQTINIDQAAIPRWGMDKIFYTLRGNYRDAASVNGGIIIAIVLAVVMYLILNKTTFGYELKACGHNRDASQYAGINQNRSIILSMMIAGALSGVAGALMYLAPRSGLHMQVVDVLAPQGFNGIPVALLGLSNPIGIIFSAIFVAYISQGGFYLQRMEYMPEIIDIIIGAIIYFSAFSLFVKQVIASVAKRREIQGEQEESTQ